MQPLKLPGPLARTIVERDRAVISPSYPRSYPFIMDHGKGFENWDGGESITLAEQGN